MQTPTHYKNNLKNKVLTEEMLADALFSANKRAKNYRDLNRRNRKYFENDSNIANMEKFYGYKDKMLSILEPQCIHHHRITKRYRKFHTDEYVYYPIENKDFTYEVSITDLYFLYYEVGDKTFHSPISSPETFPDLIVKRLPDNFETRGHNPTSLISAQFVKKVVDLIDSDSFEYKKVT